MDNSSESIESGKGGIVTARGTGDGLVIRLDGRVDKESLRGAVEEFMFSRRGFLSGNRVSLEWVGKKPDSAFIDELSGFLRTDYNIEVRDSRLKGAALKGEVDLERLEEPLSSTSRGLFGGVGDFESSDELEDFSVKSDESAASELGTAGLWDDPDARVVFSTLRSGQKVETEHSLIVVGDVNPGAELVAGGDIIVLGSLRGTAHAGAYDETGGGRIIFALNLQPTQLRIGMVISRGSPNVRKVPEVARVEGELIVVEEFSPKSPWFEKRS